VSLVSAMEDAYLNCRLFPDGPNMKWSKLLTNLLANATSAILDMTPAEIIAHRVVYKVEIAMLRECLAVMRGHAHSVVDLPGVRVRALAAATRWPLWISRPLLAGAVGRGRGGKMPSLHIDLHSGRGKSEVAYLHGAVVRAGAEIGIATPINKLLTDTLVAMADGQIPLEAYARRPEKLLAKMQTPR